MRTFLINILLFLSLTSLLIGLLAVSTGLFTKGTFDFHINENKNILILGNSHPECAIDDSILSNSFNLAQSGSAYFYDYLKLREVIKHNVQIDTVVLGYSYGDLKENMDFWFTADDKINNKLRSYFFLLKAEDYLALLKANPASTLKHTPRTIFHNVKMKYKGYGYLGKFKPLVEHRLAEDKELIKSLETGSINKYSKYQIQYLLKIYEFCESNNLTLILLNTPIHKTLEEIQQPLTANYCSFVSKNLPNAYLVDHSNLTLPESGYRDLSHLHRSGAEIYSKYLKSGGLTNTLQKCP